MLKNEKGKFILSILIVLIITGLLAWQGVIVISNKINNNISELKDKKISKDVYGLKDKALEQEQEAFYFSKNKIEKINNYFVYESDNDDTEFTYFFGLLDNIAFRSTGKEDSLTIDLHQAEVATVKNTKKTTATKDSSSGSASMGSSRLLKLTLMSDFKGLINFISNLEAMPYYVYIQSVNTNIDSEAQAVTGKKSKISPVNTNVKLQTVLVIKVFRKTNVL